MDLQELWDEFIEMRAVNELTPNNFWLYVDMRTDEYTYGEVMHFCDEEDYNNSTEEEEG